jgi:hypothetical protein
MEFMQNPETTRPYLQKADPMTQHFFETQFFSPVFDATRQQILNRLWGVLSNSVLERMFASTHNKVDLFTAMNSGNLILINTAKDLLKQDGCEIFGRFFISLISMATQERASIPEDRRKRTFVYIDEAQDYFGEEGPISQLFNSARKYKVGLIIAHQNLDQFSPKLCSTVMTNAKTKIVGGLSQRDAEIFAKEMGCEPEHIQMMKKQKDHTDFMFLSGIIWSILYG